MSFITYQAAPLVIPPCWANSDTGESQPGVEGFDILQIFGMNQRHRGIIRLYPTKLRISLTQEL